MGGGTRDEERYGVYASVVHGARGWCMESRVDEVHHA